MMPSQAVLISSSFAAPSSLDINAAKSGSKPMIWPRLSVISNGMYAGSVQTRRPSFLICSSLPAQAGVPLNTNTLSAASATKSFFMQECSLYGK